MFSVLFISRKRWSKYLAKISCMESAVIRTMHVLNVQYVTQKVYSFPVQLYNSCCTSCDTERIKNWLTVLLAQSS